MKSTLKILKIINNYLYSTIFETVPDHLQYISKRYLIAIENDVGTTYYEYSWMVVVKERHNLKKKKVRMFQC